MTIKIVGASVRCNCSPCRV